MHTFSTFQYTCYIWTVLELFCLFLSSPSLFYFTLVVFMAPKCKSTLAQNPLHSDASSSSDSAPLSLFGSVMMMPIRYSQRTFLDAAFILNAKSFWWTSLTPTFPLSFIVGDESHCVTSESLCDVLVTCPFVLIYEFYSNMHEIDCSVPLFFTCIRGTHIPITLQLVADVLRVPRVEFPNYPSCEHLWTVSKDELKSAFCECPSK